jgi:hypothetical protein
MRNMLTTLLLAGAAFGQTSYSHIEEMSNWHTIIDVWAKGDHAPQYQVRQGISSPSLDGNAIEASILGGSPFSNILSYKTLGSFKAGRYYTLDYYVWVDHPENMQAVEMAALQRSGYQWYKFSTQCSFAGGRWRFWSGGSKGHWNNASAPCQRLSANTWNHIVLNWEIVSGKTHLISVATNGKNNYINLYGVPEPKSTNSNSLAVHYQIDGNSAEAPFHTFIDRVQLTVR